MFNIVTVVCQYPGGGLSACITAFKLKKSSCLVRYFDNEKVYCSVENNLQRDIMYLTPVSDDMKFYRFLCAVAAATGSIVNYANLGKAAGVTSPTAKQWATHLKGAGLMTYLRPLEHPALKRTAKAPKLYFRDIGLAAYLLHIGSVTELTQSIFFGALYEAYVYNRIRESYLAAGQKADLSYFRDSNAREISLLLREGNVIYPIDIIKENFFRKETAEEV